MGANTSGRRGGLARGPAPRAAGALAREHAGRKRRPRARGEPQRPRGEHRAGQRDHEPRRDRCERRMLSGGGEPSWRGSSRSASTGAQSDRASRAARSARRSRARRRSGRRAEEPRRQLRVLVDRPALVPAAVLVERRAAPHAREDAGVDVVLLVGLPLAIRSLNQRRTEHGGAGKGVDVAVAREASAAAEDSAAPGQGLRRSLRDTRGQPDRRQADDGRVRVLAASCRVRRGTGADRPSPTQSPGRQGIRGVAGTAAAEPARRPARAHVLRPARACRRQHGPLEPGRDCRPATAAGRMLDLNLARPGLAARLGHAEAAGVRAVVAGTLAVGQAMLPTAVPQLHLLPAGDKGGMLTSDAIWPAAGLGARTP